MHAILAIASLLVLILALIAVLVSQRYSHRDDLRAHQEAISVLMKQLRAASKNDNRDPKTGRFTKG